MNKFIAIGRLTADPELKSVGAESHVTNFTIAINRPPRRDADHPEADFIPCVAWNKTAENIVTYFSKGERICVSGPIEVRKYEDKDGNRRTAFECRVMDFDFIEKKNDSGRTNAVASNDDDDDDLPV